jgi:hypothetical protein
VGVIFAGSRIVRNAAEKPAAECAAANLIATHTASRHLCVTQIFAFYSSGRYFQIMRETNI